MPSISSVIRGIKHPAISTTDLLKWSLLNLIRTRSAFADALFTFLFGPVLRTEDELQSKYERNCSGNPEELNVEIPYNFSRYPGKYQELLKGSGELGDREVPEPCVTILRGARLIGRYPIGITASYRIAVPAVVKTKILIVNILNNIKYYASSPSAMFSQDAGEFRKAVLLYNGWSSNYAHWTFDDLLRLQYVDSLGPDEEPDAKLIIPPEPASWQLESLHLLGYTEDDWIRWKYAHASVDELLVPTPRSGGPKRGGITSQDGMLWLREKMLSSVEPSVDGEFSKRVYVSRADATRRRVLNESDVIDALDDYGFETYVMSDLSVEEQMRLFNQAEIVISPHGANLTNLVYAEDALIVALFTRNVLVHSYFCRCQLVEVDFDCLLCDAVGPDLVVDTADLEEKVQQYI